MASMLDSLIKMMGQQNIGQISRQVNAPKDKTKRAVTDITALLTGALANNASKKRGVRSLSDALKKDHDGRILDDLSSYIDNYQQSSGDGILSHVLGNNRRAVEQGLSQKNGLDINTISRLLTLAAPIILGLLGKTQRQNGLDLGGLSSLLGNEQNQAKDISPEALDILNRSQTARSTGRRRSPIVTIIIIGIIIVVVYFLLRACGIL